MHDVPANIFLGCQLLIITSELQQQVWMDVRKKGTKAMFLNAKCFLTSVTVDGENAILVATEYGVCDPLSAVGLVAGLHFCDPSALTKTK